MENLLTLAKEFKVAIDQSGGVVFFYENTPYCWREELGTATTEKPGVIAIFDDGSRYIAVGGNDYDGAENWEKWTELRRAI